MSFTVRYLPLKKIKPDLSLPFNENMKHLRQFLLDCMHLLVVKRNQKEGNFVIVSGIERYDYLRKHTNHKYVPCIFVDDNPSSEVKSFVHYLLPQLNTNRITPASWSILRSFLRQEPRFKHLSFSQQVKVVLLGIRYKKTVIGTMKAKVSELTQLK